MNDRILHVGLGLLALGSGILADADERTQWEYRFHDAAQSVPEWQGQPLIADGILQLDGVDDYAIVPDSRDLHLTDQGLTLTATVRFRDNGTDTIGVSPDAFDMIIAKDNEYLLARNGDQLYFNIHNGEKWAAPLLGGKPPAPGEWTHLAATVQYVNDVAQGDVGYRVTVFVNGEAVSRGKFLYLTPNQGSDPVEIGRGFGGGPWFFHGDMAEAASYNRALSEGEIAVLAERAPGVKIVRQGEWELAPESANALADWRAACADPRSQWLAGALERSARRGADQKQLLTTLAATRSISAGEHVSEAEWVKRWNEAQSQYTLAATPDLLLLFHRGAGRGGSPLAGVMDKRAGQDIFGSSTVGWKSDFLLPTGEPVTISDFSDGVTFDAPEITVDDHEINAVLRWHHPDFTATSTIRALGARVEMDFQIARADSAALPDSVTFPFFRLARRDGGNDTLVHPVMSGVLVPNPTQEQLAHGQDGDYPSGRVVMQFGAYYDDRGGVYFALEDPKGSAKYYSIMGKRGNLEGAWSIGLPVNDGDSFTFPGKFVMETYAGDWFEAGRIYRRFLRQSSNWWIDALPRTDTPAWFRNNTLWLLGFTGDTPPVEFRDELIALRDELELPYGIHWYDWNDPGKGWWPTFRAYDFIPAFFQEVRQHGIYVKPYIDARLWAIKDGPYRQTDLTFESTGRTYAVKNRDGSLNYEDYGNGDILAVMCPAASGWQTRMEAMCREVAANGVDGLYHDQTATGKPIRCFDTTHAHQPGAPEQWMEQGYLPMYRNIREKLKAEYPNLIHDTEENAEPYLGCFDGFMVWRWTQNNQIPLFQSIYAGRIQFTGRLFDHQAKGDDNSFYEKLAMQTIHAEQLGWFTPNDLRNRPERRDYVKKLMHLRYALLPWFNEGEMEKPWRFQPAQEPRICHWGAVGSVETLKLPPVLHSVWLAPNGLRMAVFINTTLEEQIIHPVLPPMAPVQLVIRSENSTPLITTLTPENVPAVVLPPRAYSVWFIGDNAEAVSENIVLNQSFVSRK